MLPCNFVSDIPSSKSSSQLSVCSSGGWSAKWRGIDSRIWVEIRGFVFVVDNVPVFHALSMETVGWEPPEIEDDRAFVDPAGKTDSMGECGEGGR